jgi:hypothetical protein
MMRRKAIAKKEKQDKGYRVKRRPNLITKKKKQQADTYITPTPSPYKFRDMSGLDYQKSKTIT